MSDIPVIVEYPGPIDLLGSKRPCRLYPLEFGELLHTSDQRGALAASVNKRKPVWSEK